MGDLVLYPLTRRLPARPQLQVLQVIVCAVAVAVMDRFVRPERAAEGLRHNEAMLGVRRLPAGQVSKLGRHRHVAIAVADEAGAGHLADRLVGLHVTVLALAVGVGLAEPAGHSAAIAAVDHAGPVHAAAQWTFGFDVAVANKPQVMAMTKSAFGRGVVADRD